MNHKKELQLIYEPYYKGVFTKTPKPFKFMSFPTDIKADDCLHVEKCPDDPAKIFIIISRPRAETDEEYTERMKIELSRREAIKDWRRAQYLELKKEFENEEGTKVQECKEGDIQI